VSRGCVTAKVLGNMIDAIKNADGELDFNLCDGFDELKDDATREIIKAAFERGYVSDEGWKGVSLPLVEFATRMCC
jgi:hypothetical protein